MNWSGALFSFPLTNKSLSWYIRDSNIPMVSDAFIYKVVDIESNQSVGHISLGGLSWKNRSARITRVFVNPSSGCKGVCQAMTKAILKIGFDELSLHRIGLGVYSHNLAAIRCYEKAGLVQEGTQRDVLLYNKQFMSMVEMAVLEPEWRAQLV
jgi:RimJ/RimL family protein N-acetyltransferase